MQNKRSSKVTFFVILALILLLTFTAFFGVSSFHGDTKNTYIKGASDIRWGIDIRGGVEAVFTPDLTEGSITDSDMDSAQAIMETRLVSENITDYEIYNDKENNQIIVRFPWAADDTEFDPSATVQSLGATAQLTFCKGESYDENQKIFTGEHVDEATAVYYAEEGWVVALKLDDYAAGLFATATSELVNKGSISIWMDQTNVSTASVNAVISDGNAIIQGKFDADSAKALADKINAGSLPFSLSPDDSKLSVVSATLGSKALNVMLIAGSIAFGLVCLLMILRYRMNGFVAAIALLGQLAGTIAAISGFFGGLPSFTLTVPGIAGIILSIGVGVDCNVIAAERIRDEFRNGKTIDGAISSGYQSALSAIIDGNVTIVIVALVLMGAFGTSGLLINKLFSLIFGASIAGSIYSFGYTLLVGVIFNLIMGLLASKYMLRSVSQLKLFRKPWLYGGNAKPRIAKPIAFNRVLKKILIGYGALFLVGVIVTCIFGAKLDINFKGGTVVTCNYTYDEANNVADINLDEVQAFVKEQIGVDATVRKSSAMASDEYTLTISLVKNEAVSTENLGKLTTALNEKYPDNNLSDPSYTSVNPTMAGSFFLKSLAAVLLTGILVVIYVAFRFRKIGGVTAALTALVALVLDILVSFFICVIFRLQIDSNYIAVVLTILGYSLNDTIVVYDRVRENKKLYHDEKLSELVNRSLNGIMTRNILTTITTVIAVLTIIVVAELFGLTSLRTFAIPMTFGLISGCMSSLFVAAPLWVVWKNKLDRKKQHR